MPTDEMDLISGFNQGSTTDETTMESKADANSIAKSGEASVGEKVNAKEEVEDHQIMNDDPEQELNTRSNTDTDDYQEISFKDWTGGRYEDFDAVPEDMFDIYDQNPKLMDAYEKAIAENEQLRSQQSTAPKFASPLVEKLNDYIANGGGDISQFVQLQNTDVDGLSDIEVLSIHKQINEGLSADDAKFIVENQYILDEDADPNKQRLVNIQLKQEANKARAALNESKVKDLTPYSVSQSKESEQIESKRLESWNNASDDIHNAISSLEIEIGDGDILTAELSEDELSEYQEELRGIISNNKELRPDQHGIDYAKEFVQNRFILKNIKTIIAEAQKQVRSQMEQKHFEENHNPSAKDQVMERPDSQTKSKSWEDQVRQIENF